MGKEMFVASWDADMRHMSLCGVPIRGTHCTFRQKPLPSCKHPDSMRFSAALKRIIRQKTL
jgi:hypothetical protein